MRRAAGELAGDGEQVDPEPRLERRFADLVLLCMMMPAEADAVTIRWFQSNAAIRAAANVRALGRQALTCGYDTVVASHPSSVGRAGARLPRRPRPFDASWQPRHRRALQLGLPRCAAWPAALASPVRVPVGGLG